MRIKKYFVQFSLSAFAVLFFGLLVPAFAGMNEIDETDLAQVKASVTGTPIKNFNCVEKDGICADTKQDTINSGNVADASSPAAKGITTGVIDINQHINGQTTFKFHFGGGVTNVTGGIISVKPH